jgi:hypothetical protein
MVRLAVWMCLWLTAGCVRLVTPAQAGPAPGAVQACKQDGECDSGHCVDGVCCNAACTDGCHSCTLAGSVGRCLPVDDNTDPRAVCEPCHSCFGGTCQVSTLGTQSKQECGNTQTCNGAGECGLSTGEACDPRQATPCATRLCLFRTCGSGEERLLPAPYGDTTMEYPLRLVNGRNGAALLSSAYSVQVDQGTSLTEPGCPVLLASFPVQVLHYQTLTPGLHEDVVLDGAREPADMVETGDGHRVFHAVCGAMNCDVKGLSLTTGVETPVGTTRAHSVTRLSWLYAARSAGGKTAVAVGPDAAGTRVSSLPSSPLLWWLDSGSGFQELSTEGWLVAQDASVDVTYVGETPLLLGVKRPGLPEPPDNQLFALTVDDQGMLVKVLLDPVPGCLLMGQVRVRDLGNSKAHVAVQCGDPATLQVTRLMQWDVDVSVAGQLGFGPPADMVMDPPLPEPPGVFALVGRGDTHSLVFQEGRSLNFGWRGDDGNYLHTPINSVARLEPEVVGLELVGGEAGAFVAWSTAHVVERTLVTGGCSDNTLRYYSGRMAVASLRY